MRYDKLRVCLSELDVSIIYETVEQQEISYEGLLIAIAEERYSES